MPSGVRGAGLISPQVWESLVQCLGEGASVPGSAPLWQRSLWHRTGELLLDQGDQLVLEAGSQPKYPLAEPFYQF